MLELKGEEKMDPDKASMPSSGVLLEWARFLGVSPDTVRPSRIEPQIKRLLDEFNRLEKVDLTNIEPSIIFSTMRELKNEEY